ncbi:hypothetical protein YC2023_094676 [Brassica napus]
MHHRGETSPRRLTQRRKTRQRKNGFGLNPTQRTDSNLPPLHTSLPVSPEERNDRRNRPRLLRRRTFELQGQPHIGERLRRKNEAKENGETWRRRALRRQRRKRPPEASTSKDEYQVNQRMKLRVTSPVQRDIKH